MSGIEVTIEDTGLRRLMANASKEFNVNVLLRAIALRQRKWIDDNFRGEGKLSVGGWGPLKAATIARRRKGSSQILQDTGRLKGSFDTLDIGDTYVVVGSRLRYAATHNFGRGSIPARRMLPDRGQAKALATGILKATVEKFTRKG